jgi:hypothetical protein
MRFIREFLSGEKLLPKSDGIGLHSWRGLGTMNTKVEARRCRLGFQRRARDRQKASNYRRAPAMLGRPDACRPWLPENVKGLAGAPWNSGTVPKQLLKPPFPPQKAKNLPKSVFFQEKPTYRKILIEVE